MPYEIHIDLDQIVEHFENLEDPRSEINRKHPLVSVIVISLMAVLANANGPTAIAVWARQKEDFLLQTLCLPHGLPRKDVFRRVLSALKPEAFQACFANWLQALKTNGPRPDGRRATDLCHRRQDAASQL